jgi:hypothetical protein
MFYSIQAQYDPPLLRVALRGFWTMETFNAYMRDCGDAIGKIVTRHGRFDTLGDCTDFAIQGPDVSAAFQHLKTMSEKTPQNRIALYSSSALSRKQAERTVGNSHSKVFSSEAAAREWLGIA